MDEFEISGVWWLPNNEEKKVPGTLKFNTTDGGNLELIGELFSFNVIEVDIILGKTVNGKNVTLYDCFTLRNTLVTSGIPTTLIFANMIFEGVHFYKEEDIKFKEISCRYANLDEWAWMNGIQVKQSKPKEIEIKYNYPPSIKVNIGNDYMVEIYARAETSVYSMVQKHTSITQKTYVKIINNNFSSFEDHRDKLYHMQNFISLGVGVPVDVLEFIAKSEGNKEELEGHTIYPEVKIYYTTKLTSNNYKQVSPNKMLFTLKDIRCNLNNILEKWFDMQETLGPVFDLYFGTLYNRNMYLQQRFLSLIQSIESYHRRTRINNETDIEEHKNKLKHIIKSVDDKYQSWLENRLTYSNEPTLRDRLKELLEECGPLLELESSRKKKSFINKVCNTRNYLTHYDISLENKIVKGLELLTICNLLEIIIIFNLLSEVDFSNEKIKEILKKRYGRYQTPESIKPNKQ